MSTTKNHIPIRNKTSSTLLKKALGLWIINIGNVDVDVCEIQWWFLLKRNKTSSTLWMKALGLWIFDISNVDVCKIQCWKQNLFHSLEEGVGSWCVAKLVQVSKRHSLTLLMKTMTKRSWSSKRNEDYNDNNKDTTRWKLLPIIIGANKRNRNCVRLEHHEQLVSVANTWIYIDIFWTKQNRPVSLFNQIKHQILIFFRISLVSFFPPSRDGKISSPSFIPII